MLKELMKAAGFGPAEKPQAEGDGIAVELTVDAVKAELDTMRAEFESFKETAEGMVAQAEEAAALLATELANTKTALEAAQAALTTAAAEKQAIVEDIEAKRLTARKEKIVAAVGTDKADALFAATETLDDTAFDAVVSALVGGVDAESKSPLFKEVGAAAEVDASKVAVSGTMRILQDKYKEDSGKN